MHSWRAGAGWPGRASGWVRGRRLALPLSPQSWDQQRLYCYAADALCYPKPLYFHNCARTAPILPSSGLERGKKHAAAMIEEPKPSATRDYRCLIFYFLFIFSLSFFSIYFLYDGVNIAPALFFHSLSSWFQKGNKRDKKEIVNACVSHIMLRFFSKKLAQHAWKKKEERFLEKHQIFDSATTIYAKPFHLDSFSTNRRQLWSVNFSVHDRFATSNSSLRNSPRVR